MIRFIVITLSLLWSLSAYAYTPPIGIPNPSVYFGFEIDRPSPESPDSWGTNPTTATAGKYYIDNSVICSDSGNTYGHPDNPRCTLPSFQNLQPGTDIYIAGGTYSGTWYVSGGGTQENPIWIRGNPDARPVMSKSLLIGYNVTASYFIIENLDFIGTSGGPYLRTASATNVSIDHILMRKLVVTGTGTASDSRGIAVGNSAVISGSSLSYIVVYDSEISNLGDKTSQDRAGVSGGMDVSYLWVLNSRIKNTASDSVAGCATCTEGHAPSNYFVGGNSFHGNGENCIDFKGIKHFVISENDCYGPFTREQGWGFVIHQQDAAHSAAEDGWIIFNRLHHLSAGIAFTTGGNANMHAIGNVIYDIKASYAAYADPPYNGNAILCASVDQALDIVDNTIYDMDQGIKIMPSLSAEDSVRIHGNIISARSNTSLYDLNIATNGSESYVDMDYNQFYLSEGSAKFRWANGDRDLVYMQGTASECANCIEANPLFVDPPNSFALQTLSPAIGANVEGPVGGTVYDLFYTTWGISIEKDLIGTARPQNSTWDMGAIEYLSEGGDTAPPNLSEATPVPTPTTDSTPSVVVNSNEACTPHYSGTAGAGDLTSLASGDNTITFGPLQPGVYTASLTCTDSAANTSDSLGLTGFAVKLPGNKVLGGGNGKGLGGGSGVIR
jgi:hypothetical protein